MADLPVLVDPRGVPRVLAALPPHGLHGVPRMAATRVVLPRGQWQEVDLTRTWPLPIEDQGRSSACTGHMEQVVAALAWARRTNEVVRFSPTFGYALCNGDRDQGAVISDVVRSLATAGICLASEFPEGHIYRRQIPPQAFQTALRYRLGEWSHVPTFDEMATAITLGMPAGVGVLVGNNVFQAPGGVCPVPDRVVGGHALPVVGLINRAGRWLLKVQNSWTADWGDRGYGYLSEEFINYTAETTRRQWGVEVDAFAAEAMTSDPGDAEPVAPAPTP
jgi:hypothetical protein